MTEIKPYKEEKTTEEQLTNLAKTIIYVALVGHLVLLVKSEIYWLNTVITVLVLLLLWGFENKVKHIRKTRGTPNERTNKE